MMVVVMGDVVEALEHPMSRHPWGDHFVAGMAGDVDNGIVGQICEENDRLHGDENHNQTEANELQTRF